MRKKIEKRQKSRGDASEDKGSKLKLAIGQLRACEKKLRESDNLVLTLRATCHTLTDV